MVNSFWRNQRTEENRVTNPPISDSNLLFCSVSTMRVNPKLNGVIDQSPLLSSPRCHSRLKLHCGLRTKSPNLCFLSVLVTGTGQCSGQCRHLVTSHRDSPSVSGVMDSELWSHLNTASSDLPYKYTRENNHSRLFSFPRCERDYQLSNKSW